MLAAKKGRQEQLEILEQYEAGQPVEFKSHQGKGFEFQKEGTIRDRRRASQKVRFQLEALFLDAAGISDVEAVELMLKQGMDPNVRNPDGLTALHQACIENSLKLVTLLLNNGADVNATDNDWWTPLHAAAACGHWRILNFLITKEADITAVNADGDLAVDLVEGEKTAKILEDELEHQGIDDDKMEEIRRRHENHLRAVVEEKIASKADLDEPLDELGVRLVHVAACNGYPEILEMLLKAGANPNVQDHEKETPLHLAAFFQEYKCAELLGKFKADTEIPNKHNEPPIVVTEDVTMIRLLKALQNQQTVELGDVTSGSRERLNSSVKRKSLGRKQSLAKQDVKRGKEIETSYAELEFARKGKGKGSDKKSSGKKGKSTVYAELDHDDGTAAIDHIKLEKKQQEEAASGMYATPRKGRRSSADVGKDSVTKVNPKVKAPVKRHASLAAIAVEEGQTPEGVDVKAKGGCCVVQ